MKNLFQKRPHPRWYRIFSDAVNIVWLTALIVAHAKQLAVAARQIREMEEAERQNEVLRFEPVSDFDVIAEGGDDDSVCSEGTVDDPSAPFSAHLNSAARRICNVAQLRPKQEEAVERIVLEEKTDGKLIAVDRTGGGKPIKPR